mgnify:CR=1 FL=1
MEKNKIVLEYIWIDADNELRSKTRILSAENFDSMLDNFPQWTFDGSSTDQASGSISDIILKPIKAVNNPFVKYTESYLVLCECYEKCGKIPAKNNNRFECDKLAFVDKDSFLFGIEQEYVIFDKLTCLPYKWENESIPSYYSPLNGFYCSVGGQRTFGRHIVDEHLQLCLEAGLTICGTNAEVMASQWEFQIGPCHPRQVCDELWLARYILQRITEKYNCFVSFHPKPFGPDWPGSGAHTNFSTWQMRNKEGILYIIDACEKLRKTHNECIAVYGKYNEQRLTGKNETANINEYTYGIGDRNASIRIPLHVANNRCGYIEDRRPGANIDPYLVVTAIMKSLQENNEPEYDNDSGYDSYS